MELRIKEVSKPISENKWSPDLRVTKPLERMNTYNPLTGKNEVWSGIENPNLERKMTVPWYTKDGVFRLATIGDGNCMIHAIVSAYFPGYRSLPYSGSFLFVNNNPVSTGKIQFSWLFRTNIASQLSPFKFLVSFDSKTPYVMSNEENLSRYENYLEFDPNWVDKCNEGVTGIAESGEEIRFCIDDMFNLFNSTNYLGEEALNCLSYSITSHYNSDKTDDNKREIVINVMNADIFNMLPHASSQFRYQSLPKLHIFIVGRADHYETIALKRNGAYVLLFNENDPFVIASNTSIIHKEIYSKLRNYSDLIQKGLINDNTFDLVSRLNSNVDKLLERFSSNPTREDAERMNLINSILLTGNINDIPSLNETIEFSLSLF